MRRWEWEGSQKLMGRMAATLPPPGVYREASRLVVVLVGRILATDPRPSDRAARREVLRTFGRAPLAPVACHLGRRWKVGTVFRSFHPWPRPASPRLRS